MDARGAEESLSQFMRVAEYLLVLGFSAPRLFDHDLSSGFLTLEDFGEATYTRLLTAGQDPYPLYDLAVDTLIALHRQAVLRPQFVPLYDGQALLNEAQMFVDWYLSTLERPPLPLTARQAYADAWLAAFGQAYNGPQSLVLRDYHVDNLMYLEGRPGVRACGLLDFQDARWGPVAYDLVSLLEDARLDLEPKLVSHGWRRYLAAFPDLDEQELRKSGCILGASRHAKIIGIFSRLAVRDGKTHYLRHVPRVLGLLQTCLQHPDLKEIKEWFKEWVT